MRKATSCASYETLRSFAFDSRDRCAAIPHGMHSGSGSGPVSPFGVRYSGRAATGSTSESYVVLCLDERRSLVRKPAGRTALLHIVTPTDENLLEGLRWAENFSVETLAMDNRTPQGLVAAHETHIPLDGSTRSHAVMSHISSISGDPSCPEKLLSPVDLVDLDWRGAGTADFDMFAGVVTEMIDEYTLKLESR